VCCRICTDVVGGTSTIGGIWIFPVVVSMVVGMCVSGTACISAGSTGYGMSAMSGGSVLG
jgi:hypothetical protein